MASSDRDRSQLVPLGVHGGFLQVLNNLVTLITDRAQVAEGGKEEAQAVAEALAEGVEEPDE